MLSPWLALPLMLVFSGAVLLALAVALMLRLLLQPPRMTDGKAMFTLRRLSPEDLGLCYQDMTFHVRDEATGQKLKIAAWWMPAIDAGRSPMGGSPTATRNSQLATAATVVLIHGYSDAKVGAIAWAPLFHALGYNVFALDLRAHGESDGKYVTGGYHERHDLDQVLTELRQLRPAETRQLILFGISLGAAVAAGTALLRDDIAAVILECPYADYRRAAMTHAKLLGVPGGPVAKLVLWLAQKRTRADYSAVRPVDLIRRVHCPLMVIRGEEDYLVEPRDAAELEAAARVRDANMGPTQYWSVPNAGHVLGLVADPETYRRRIEQFLAAALDAQAAGRPEAVAPRC